MMRSLGNYIVRGRWQAIWVLGFCSLISLPISGILLCFITLRRGAQTGIEVLAGSSLFVLLLSLLAGLNPAHAMTHVLGSWVPLYVCSLVLRQTEQQGKLVVCAGGFGMLFVLLMHSLVGDAETFWRTTLDTQLLVNFPEEVLAQYKAALEIMMPFMNAIIFSSFVVGLIITVFIARWWQSRLFNPGGFRTEFRSLSLPSWLALPTAVGLGLLLTGNQGIMLLIRDWLIIVAFMYAFQGISTVHRIVGLRALARAWLVFMYVLLFVIPQMMVLFLAFIGLADGWRNRAKNTGGNDES